jgi:hypothetical protein
MFPEDPSSWFSEVFIKTSGELRKEEPYSNNGPK